jgi:DNA ligase (NAD+)
MIEREKIYLKWKYLYYNGKTEVSDSVYDEFEEELRKDGSNLVEIVGSPSYEILAKYNLLVELVSGDREVRFVHEYAMLSLKKYQVTLDENDKEVYPIDISNFFSKKKGSTITCTPKFDGNSMELTYVYGNLYRALTRGDELGGLDRTSKMKLIVPNQLPGKYIQFRKTIIRGEVIIPTALWEEKYSDPNKVDNPRNWLAGKITKDEIDIELMNDISFVAYQITIFEDKTNRPYRPIDQLGELHNIGFDDVFHMETNTVEDFFNRIYPTFKEYRISSKFALDGIVLNFPSDCWEELGETEHHPNWACAVKFVPNRAITTLEDIIWTLGKDSELTPVGCFSPVELDGTIVKHASLYNFGWIVDNKIYPGCVVEIAKQGDIIPALKRVLKKSDDDLEYTTYIENFINEHKI